MKDDLWPTRVSYLITSCSHDRADEIVGGAYEENGDSLLFGEHRCRGEDDGSNEVHETLQVEQMMRNWS